jgi:phenylalanyl-tRNA synthetase beta chain
VANPPSAEEPFLRTSLLPRLLDAARRNLQVGAGSVALFEVGHVFRLGGPVDEREHLAIVLAGRVGEGLHAEDRPFDVLDAKGVVEALLAGVGIAWTLEPDEGPPLHPGRSGIVMVDGRPVGRLGELHPAVAERLDLTGRVAVAELDVTALDVAPDRTPIYRDVPRFPPVRRDLAFVIAEDVPAGAVLAELQDAAGELLDRALLFDVFAGGGLPPGHRSLAFSLAFRAPDRTLTDEEVEPALAAIVERLADAFGATLRG